MSTNPSDTGSFGTRPDAPNPIVPKSASEALRPTPGTPPPRRSRRARSQFVIFMNFVMSAIVLVTIGAGAAVWYGKYVFEGPGPSTKNDTVLIKPNTGVNDIALLLERNRLISDANIFRLGVRAYGNDSALKAGEYEVKAGASMRDIMELLKSGKSLLYSLTLPEGLTVEQAFSRIATNEALTGEMPDEMPPEGALIADTQRVTRGTTRKEVIAKMIEEQKELVESIWARRAPDLPLKDINEFVTLASIVEKETGIADERSRVAAVFINRLNKGMRLQSDPTIVYGIYGGKGKPADKPITRSDIDKPTPYNTYAINGLPPGPIANPGRAALEAVANPSKTDDLYFVADGTGGHVFAATLDEHNENVARWRQVEKKQAEEAAKAAAEAAKAGAVGTTGSTGTSQ
ncbi:endolytic transglycosylase MltG [Mesorhizobium sp. J428]|uniref:endolytic transglycosylase MltG n=1 Tax=Mesorhizobium sp. J428 TaxID=2898440 RepID=UPI002150E274|nr:endolytic transglycosylase MltG [Mesorhizobium sp. J428]MCR5859115.1 endolytic transglycosylase MltG [Mesorhizobium sp. J428]